MIELHTPPMIIDWEMRHTTLPGTEQNKFQQIDLRRCSAAIIRL